MQKKPEAKYMPIPFVRELCKHKTEEEIREAEDNFREFLSIIFEISRERLKRKKLLDEQEDNLVK